MSKSLLFVGCCNRPLPYFATANGQGIAAFRIDDDSGAVEALGVTEGIDNPTFLAANADGRVLCVTSEVLGWNEGTITAYAVDAVSGQLTYLNKQPTRGNLAAHLSFDGSGRFAASVNYAVLPTTARPNSSVVVYPLAADGELGPPAAEVTHVGKGVDATRQDRPHAHCVRWTPDNRFVVVADLGIDRLAIYAFDAGRGGLTPHGELVLPPGTGPRHFAFHPTRPLAYAVNELASSLASLAFDAAAGSFRLIGLEATVPPHLLGHSHCSAIKVAPGGRHLFVGNRGEDTLSRFDIEPETGVARRIAATPAGGRTPRDFDFSPGGGYLAVANQDSDEVRLFRYDAATGALTPFGAPIQTGTPTAIGWTRAA